MKWSCSHCGHVFQIPEGGSQPAVRCPHCGRATRPPAGQEDATQGEPEPPAVGGGWFSTSVSSLVSLVFHLVLLLVCALVTYDRGGSGPVGEEVQVGLLPEVELSRSPAEELETSEAETTAARDQLEEVLTPLAPASAAAEDNPFGVGFLEVAPFGDGGQLGEIGGPPRGGGIGDHVTFMNVRATGRRFCIIADTSGSMSGPKLEYVKQEVLETVGSMKPTARFQIVFFSSAEIPYPKGGWLHPQQEYAELEAWLKTLEGSGSTQPLAAFRVAFALDPPPDAIFFMTDGLFPVTVVDEVAGLQRSTGRQVVIHTISFMDRTAEFMLQEIARNSGGTYRHVAGF